MNTPPPYNPHNPYAPPQQQWGAPPPGYGPPPTGMPGQARFEGDQLVVVKNAQLPHVCLKCGTRDQVQKVKKKFQWTPVWARMLVLVCTPAALVAMLVTQKRGELDVPLCARCKSRWTSAILALVGAVLLLIVSPFGFALAPREPAVGIIFFFLAFAAFFVILFAVMRPRILHLVKIDDNEIWFKNFDKNGAEAAVRGG